jgi:membrane-associated phospholipid phosphatase
VGSNSVSSKLPSVVDLIVVKLATSIMIISALALPLDCCYGQDQSLSGLTPKAFVGQFLRDEKNIWSSPLRIKKRDARWLLPLGVSFAALLATDRKVADRIRQTDDLSNPSQVISSMGSGGVMAAAPLAIFAVGKLSHNNEISQTGTTTLESVMHAGLVVQVLKLAGERQRPDQNNGLGLFWRGGSSFPSGHSMASWAFASALSNEYPQNNWLKFGGYGFASAVSLSRIGGLNHFPSDVLVGASMGYLIGRFVAHQHPRLPRN